MVTQNMAAKKKGGFGTYRIVPDETLGAVLGTKKPLKPSEMTKLIWVYVKKHRLSTK